MLQMLLETRPTLRLILQDDPSFTFLCADGSAKGCGARDASSNAGAVPMAQQFLYALAQ
jgi:hypothetical protein